jgi:Fe-S-cluster-containing dehydrogenase component/DMSO reductase anchor subunit
MRKGFIFNKDLCVACRSCSAACLLENRWDVKPRSVWSDVNMNLPYLSVINLSMACNHCENPACLTGCPASALHRDDFTGAVIADDNKCIGCNYCNWNCPYEAIKPDRNKGIIEKCNLCNPLVSAGGSPACVSACPTGALKYGEITDNQDYSAFPWFPETNLNPAIELSGRSEATVLTIIPVEKFSGEMPQLRPEMKNLSREWSLILFSFLTTISVSLVASSFIKGVPGAKYGFLLVLLLAGFFSIFHLGKKFRAWRAFSNFKSSPLSREIAFYVIFLTLSSIFLVSGTGIMHIAAILSGFFLLLIIDSVYFRSDNRSNLLFNGGQTFLTGLLMSSFFAGMNIAFIFISLIKVITAVYLVYSDKNNRDYFMLRYLHIAILMAISAGMLTGLRVNDPGFMLIFLIGELIGRILFYYDFEPLSITKCISDNINCRRNEKKRN